MAASPDPSAPDQSVARLVSRPGLGNTLVAVRRIECGELLLLEQPLLMATTPSKLPEGLTRAWNAAELATDAEADEAEAHPQLADVQAAHAFASAPSATRNTVLQEFCSQEACSCRGHTIVSDAQAAACWLQKHGGSLFSAPSEIARALCAFELNAFGNLADATTAGATSLFLWGSKFSHRCISPNVVFHGIDTGLAFRAARPIESGQVLSICYLGPASHASTPLRRTLLFKAKGFFCRCEDCEGVDRLRALPCPACVSRSSRTGLLDDAHMFASGDTEPLAGSAARSLLEQNDGSVQMGTVGCGMLKKWGENSLVRRSAGADLDAKLSAAAESFGEEAMAAFAQLIRGEGASDRPLWRCSTCALSCSDDDLDEISCAPPDESWRPYAPWAQRSAKWPLQLPPGGLLEWETQLDRAADALSRNLLEMALKECEATADTPRASSLPQPHPSQRQLPQLFCAVCAVLGEHHWISLRLRELLLDAWLELALVLAPRYDDPSGVAPMAAPEAKLCRLLQSRTGSCFESAASLLEACGSLLVAISSTHKRCEIEQAWEVVGDFLEALLAWRHVAHFTKNGPRWAQLRSLLGQTLGRTALEYGEGSAEVSKLQLVGGKCGLLSDQV